MRVLWGAARIAGALLAGLCAGAALAQAAPELPVEYFAHKPVMADVDLSPDGSHLAFLAPYNDRMHLVVRKLNPGPGDKPAAIAPSDTEIIGFEWVGNERLLVTVLQTDRKRTTEGASTPVRFSRLIAVSRDLKETKVLLDRPPSDTSNYYWTSIPILQFVDDEHVLVAIPLDDGPEPGVVKLNVVTGKYTRVRKGQTGIGSYIPDPSGQIRIASSYDDKTQKFKYLRLNASGYFDVMRSGSANDSKDEFSILGFDAVGQQLYVSVRKDSDRLAVFKYDMETDTLGEKVADHPRYDVGALTRRGLVVGFRWMDDLPARRWIDPELQSLQDMLDKVVPNSREIIIDTAADRRLVLVASYSLDAPTTYRLFDRNAKTFDLLGDTYPDIPQEDVAEQKPVSFKARDGLDIPGYLTLPVGSAGRNLPFIIMPHGGPSFRNSGVFDPMVQFLANRGYAVLQPNFRGSTGYGSTFEEAGHRQWGGLMQDDVTDAAQWAIAQGYADPKRLCIVGWSYGGYAALMGVVKTPDLFKCAIATAPVADMQRLYDELRYDRGKNFNRKWIFGDDPGSLTAISPTANAEKIKAPVLLVHGDLDVQAPVIHSRDMARALTKEGKSVEYIEIKNMDHSPMTTSQMATVLSAWEKFLKTHLGK